MVHVGLNHEGVHVALERYLTLGKSRVVVEEKLNADVRTLTRMRSAPHCLKICLDKAGALTLLLDDKPLDLVDLELNREPGSPLVTGSRPVELNALDLDINELRLSGRIHGPGRGCVSSASTGSGRHAS